MEDWVTRGVPSTYNATQVRAVVGLLQQASTAVRVSRRQLDRVGARLFALLTHTRTELAQDRTEGSERTVAELLEEIDSIGSEADAVLEDVELIARALSGASSVVRTPLAQFRSGGAQASKPESSSHPKSLRRSETLDDITKRQDLNYSD